MRDVPRAVFPGGGEESAEQRWRSIWSHREPLLKVARRRSMSAEDAEDAVHEAMVRAMENPQVEDERMGAWLTTVTVRLCVDRYRQVTREAELHQRPSLASPEPVPVDEAVCDRDEARWLAGRSGDLPARQVEALRLRSEDLDVGQVAHRMGLSYEAVESLLARARRTLRTTLAGTLSVLVAVFLAARRRPGAGTTGGGVQTVASATTATAAATFAVVGLALPSGSAYRPVEPRPPHATVVRTADHAAVRPDRQGLPSGAADRPDAAGVADGTRPGPSRAPGVGSTPVPRPSAPPPAALSVPPVVPGLPVPTVLAPSATTSPVAVPSLPVAAGTPTVPLPSVRPPTDLSVPTAPVTGTVPQQPQPGALPDPLQDGPGD